MPNSSASNRKIPFVKCFRILVALFVVAAIAYTVWKAASQLQESEFDFRSVSWSWWLCSLACYVGTMVFSCLFWHRVLLAFGQRPHMMDSFLAFFASQLGKYIPGKAMVVVIRTDLIRGDEVKTGPAAASVFVETLTWIFVGSAIASLLLIFRFRDQFVLQVTAALLTLAAGVLTWPPVFRRIALKVGGVGGRKIVQTFDGLNLRTMIFGWGLMTVGWCFNGLSLWLVLRGLPGTGVTLADYPLALACVSLATVAGFVSLLPGGIGVRELVMIPLLGARFGSVNAIVAAVVIRIVWLVAELMTSGMIYLLRRFGLTSLRSPQKPKPQK